MIWRFINDPNMPRIVSALFFGVQYLRNIRVLCIIIATSKDPGPIVSEQTANF